MRGSIILLVSVVIAGLICQGCGGFGPVGKIIWNYRASDDVVLVKGWKGESNVLYPRFEKKGLFLNAPEELKSRKTGWLTPWNKKVKQGDIVIFKDMEAARESGISFLESDTLKEWINKRRKKDKVERRVSKRMLETARYGNACLDYR